MFQNIFIFGCFISSALLFNMYWKKSCIANTSSNYIEPSVVAGMLVGGLPYIIHMFFLPDDYQDSYYLFNPYIIIGYTTIIYHSIRRCLEILKQTDGYSKQPILWGIQIIDPVFVNYITLRLPIVLMTYRISSNKYIFDNITNILYITLFGILYYYKYNRRFCASIGCLSGFGIIFNAIYETIYRNEWHMKYNMLICSLIYIGIIYKWQHNRISNQTKHKGDSYPELIMYIADITGGFIMYRGNHNYLEYIDNRTF